MSSNSTNQTITQAPTTNVTVGMPGTHPGAPTSSGPPQDSSVEVTQNQMKTFSTTVFVDDADTVQRDEDHVDHMDPSFLVNNDTQQIEQRIHDFLAKPIVLSSNTFSTSDTYTFFNYFSMPYAAFTSTPGQMWLNKLLGFVGIRADMRFRLVSNANRFQQGRYCIGWVPLGGAAQTTSNLKQIAFNNMHMTTIVQRTTVPHVEIDLATQTSAELLVPYASVHHFWPLNSAISASDFNSLGFINVYPYSPLVAPTGSTTCGYTLYVSLENVKLFGAASPQAGGLSKREVSNKANGPISGVASSISKGFKEFAKIPVLSEFATPVSWIADRVSSVASIFGFSKPTQGDNLTKMMLLNAPSHTTVDGDSDVRPLSYLQQPGVEIPRGLSGTDYDEMDFSYIVRKYANYSTSTTITNAATPGTVVYSDNVGVNKYLSTGGNVNFLPLGFVANFFNMWRGSIRYKFKFVKTEFHSGRFAICFYPADEVTLTGDSYYVNRHIIDLRETVEIEVIIPYISRKPWTRLADTIGVITLETVDILTYPASVSASIAVMVEIAGGDDMEFAVPQPMTYQPFSAAPQSGDGEDKTSKHLSVTIGNSAVSSNPVIASGTTIGDKVSSFRTYLKRYHPFSPSSKQSTSTQRFNGTTINLLPDVIPCTIGTLTGSYVLADVTSIVASCYMFWSGGVRFRDVIDFGTSSNPGNAPSSNIITASAHLGSHATSTTAYTSTSTLINLDPNDHLVIQSGNINNVLSIELPQYTQSLSRNICDLILYQTDTMTSYYSYQGQGSTTQMTVRFSTPSAVGVGVNTNNGYDLHNLYRSLADDGCFSLFISIPPLASVGSTANANFW